MVKLLSGEPEVAPAQPLVSARVLKKGDGKISTGQYVHGLGDLYYEKGDIFSVGLDIATELEERGLAEIQPDAPSK